MTKAQLEKLVEAKDLEIESLRDAHERVKTPLQKKLREVTFQRDQLLVTTKTLVNVYGQAWNEN